MDVLVIGSCMTDLMSYTPRLPKPGETIYGSKFVVGFGGKGANQCIMAARLGARVAMVAKVGNDDFGRKYLENFKDNDVNVDYVSVADGMSTGSAQIIVNDKGENSIVIVGGANLTLEQEDVLQALTGLGNAKVVLCQLEVKPETTLFALKEAKKSGALTVFNPAPARDDLHKDFFTSCDIFCANETEAEILTGIKVGGVDDAKKALEKLLSKGCSCVILTLGEKGTVFASKDKPSPQHVPVHAVQAVDTTGAGDAFLGALAFYLSCHQGLPMEEMISRSSAIASVSVLSPGTQTSFPWPADLPKALFQS